MYGVPSQQVSCPTKVIWPTAFFSNSDHFFIQIFLSVIGWPTPYGGRLKQVILWIYIY